jgi:hypothetical protein
VNGSNFFQPLTLEQFIKRFLTKEEPLEDWEEEKY